MNKLKALFIPGLEDSYEPSRGLAKRKASNSQLKAQPLQKRVTRARIPPAPSVRLTKAELVAKLVAKLKDPSLQPTRGPWRSDEEDNFLKRPVWEYMFDSLEEPITLSDDDDVSVLDLTQQHRAQAYGHVQLDGATQECDVCMISRKGSDFPSREELPAGCSHCTGICRTCIGASLASDVENKPLNEAGCPTCKASWDRYYIERYSTAEVMMRYGTLGMLRVVQAMPNFVWCLSPKCKSGQIHQDGGKKPIVTCAACGFKMCFTHQVPWHSQLTCAQFDARQTAPGIRAQTTKEEEKTATALARYTKPCPNCGVTIWKAGGCHHMISHVGTNSVGFALRTIAQSPGMGTIVIVRAVRCIAVTGDRVWKFGNSFKPRCAIGNPRTVHLGHGAKSTVQVERVVYPLTGPDTFKTVVRIHI